MASDTRKISTPTLILAMALVTAIELLAGWAFSRVSLPLYGALGLVRIFQITAVIWVVHRREGGLAAMGWSRRDWPVGLKWGAIWSVGFALAAMAGMALLHLLGHDPFRLIRFRLPTRPLDLTMLFIVGGLIGPVAEELFFRGLLYTYFRRWGIWAALLASTVIFALLHFNALPVTQVVGGLVFALAYEIHRNLTAPMVIHVLGNLALFSLSLPMFR